MTNRIKHLAFILLLAGLAARSEASLSYAWSGEQAIRDNDPSGLAFSFNLSDAATTITSVTIALSVSGGWNGDLYAYLSSSSGFAVLLNQVGVDASNPLGYADSGMDVTLVSGSGNSDIHTYQSASPAYTPGGQLTGTWQADGRFLDPLSSTRDNTLDVFNGKDPNGEWTLFFADRNGGDVSTLTGWNVTFGAVPEPSSLALLLAGSLALLARRKRSWNKRLE
jgi:subtilisin-like proprotein convertase family protein